MTKQKRKSPVAPRNPELEARLVANPDDEEARAVFADWLQQHGDPWGELIALELAGKVKEAKAVLHQYRRDLGGGFGVKTFDWKRGFIDSITFLARPEQVGALLESMLALRTTLLVRKLSIGGVLDEEGGRAVSRLARPTLRHLHCRLSDAVGGLVIPKLERLTLFVSRDEPEVEIEALAPVFAATSLPNLECLEVGGRSLSTPFLEALLDSKLLRQLDALGFHANSLDEAGGLVVLARKRALGHLTRIQISAPDGLIRQFAREFREQTEAWSKHEADKP